MNKRQISESELRQLLEKYYSGETTRHEEDLLGSYFAETSDVPDEFADDAEMFRAMGKSKEMLAGLEKSILRDIDTLDAVRKADSRRKSRRGKWLMSIGAASAVAASIVLLLVLRPMSDTPVTSGPVTSLAHNKNISDTTHTVVGTEKVTHEDSVASVESEDSDGSADGTDSFREITDPSEASMIVRQSLSLLAANVSQSNDAIIETTSDISTIYNKIKNLKL